MGDAIRLTPSLRGKVWGKDQLAPWFPKASEPIGEAWFLAERELPLLVKLIFTSDRLSVQVHPEDGEAGPRGKTEMWHILEAEPGAEIALGFREPITRERLREAAPTKAIEKLLNWIPVAAGQTFFTKAHTVHAIGAGIVLCEIQQHSDVTYRLWDYGRPRELHLEQALPICDLGVHPGASRPEALGSGRDLLVRSKHFVTESVALAAGGEFQPSPEICQLWICLSGCGQIGGQPARQAEVWLLPETGPQPAIRAETAMRFLRTYVPRIPPA
ncbi:MAG TPA: class I mannose-6-phosphate isomerase [Bryobacteraceae bacterium]|nr:class I mannose-6-phosphate isomerase [Bryobacteraceae bacterium]